MFLNVKINTTEKGKLPEWIKIDIPNGTENTSEALNAVVYEYIHKNKIAWSWYFIESMPIVEKKPIGELQTDSKGSYRLINGKKIYQFEEKTQKDRDIQSAINSVRALGKTPGELLRDMYS